MYKRALVSLFATVLLLAGCGGGGSSSSAYSGPTSSVGITSTTEGDTVASYAMGVALSSSLSSLAGDFTPLVSNTKSELSTSPAMLGNLTKRFSDLAFKTNVSGAALMAAGVTQSETYPCGTSGTYTLTINVADPYATNPSPGDSLTFTLNNCVYGSLMDTGSVKVTFNSYTASTDYSATLTFSNYKTTEVSSGDYVKTVGAFTSAISTTGSDTTYSMTGSSVVFEGSFSGTVEQVRYSNFSFVDIFYGIGDLSFDHDFTIASTVIGGSITVNTVAPFYIYSVDSYPSSGELVVTGASNAKVRLLVVDHTYVNLYYDLDGDDVYEAEALGISWSSL